MFKLFIKLNVTGLEALSMSERINYQSYYMANEILDSISSIIDTDINVKIQKSSFITILADESTDKANKKRITLNARIVDINTSLPETVFLCDNQYEDGTGIGLSNVILNELERRGIHISRLIGFGSDGASVMTGGNKGIKGILMQKVPHLIHIHCMAHRLALCTSQAADAIPGLKKYQEWLTSLFYYFDKSSSREAELHKVQEVLNSPVLKYKEIHAVRWLSVYNVVEAVYRTLDPLISYFHQRELARDPKSKGLLKKLATRDFLYITYMLMDVLAIVSRLCLVFQEMNLDVASAKVALDTYVTDLESYKKNTQLFPTHLERFETDVEEKDGQLFFKQHHISKTNTNLLALKSNFINALIANILTRFPQKTLVEAFHILGMRTINFCSEESALEYGNVELDQMLDHFGEEKMHNGVVSSPKVNRRVVMEQWLLAKRIVRSLKYPVDKFINLWHLLTTHHMAELDQLITLAQIAMILPLHTADCERTFSQQNQILTKQRANLSSVHLDQLIRVRLYIKSGGIVDPKKVLDAWKGLKQRKLYAKKI